MQTHAPPARNLVICARMVLRRSSPSLAGANARREELIPLVRTAAHLRGHSVSKVERVGPT
jgi:hypothetical protein